MTLRGRNRMPSGVSSASSKSPSSSRAAWRMSSGSVSCPRARSVILAIGTILQSESHTLMINQPLVQIIRDLYEQAQTDMQRQHAHDEHRSDSARYIEQQVLRGY